MDARLEPYRVVVSFLGEALGPDYEVVLHDLTSEDGTIVAIVNNHISGRTEGAPLSNMALRFIQERMYEKQDYLAGYQGASQAKGGCAPLPCSSRITASSSACSASTLMPASTAASRRSCLPFAGHTPSLPPPALGWKTLSLPAGRRTECHCRGDRQRRAAARPADHGRKDPHRGVFAPCGHLYMKGAVSEVAAQLGSSEATIYRYLSKLK